MRIRRSTARALAVMASFALIASACGGGENSDPLANLADEPTAPPAIATTPPLEVNTAAPATETEPVEATLEAGPGTPAEDPHEVTVLHVKDGFQIIPAFDAPNGNEITIRDINAIDNVEIEYPLLADTYYGNRLALLVDEFDSSGNWAKVQVPVRPNNTTAWVQTAFFNKETHNYHITIDITTNQVSVFRGDVEIVNQLAVSGRESRKTPLVRAYIDEKIAGEIVSPVYGSWILSIAAFSEDLGTFGGGGMPKLALHGTNQPELMGQYVSSGCVRIPNEVVTLIANEVPVGTIVNIIAS